MKAGIIASLFALMMPLLLGFCAGPNHTQSAAAPVTVPATENKNGILFSYSETETAVPRANGSGALTLRVRYPSITAPRSKATDTVNRTLSDEVQSVTRALCESPSFLSEADECSVNITPCRTDGLLLGFRVSLRFRKAPGAWQEEISGITFSAKTGSRVAFDDLFTEADSAHLALRAVLNRELEKQERSGTIRDLNGEAVALAVAEESFGWYTEEKGLVIAFPPRTVAENENNPILVNVLFAELSDYLIPDLTDTQKKPSAALWAANGFCHFSEKSEQNTVLFGGPDHLLAFFCRYRLGTLRPFGTDIFAIHIAGFVIHAEGDI